MSTSSVLNYLKDNAQSAQPAMENNNSKQKIDWPFWSDALVNIIDDPTNPAHAHSVLERTEDLIIIRDKFPKAKFHYLVVPISCRVDTAADVTSEHIPILEKIIAKAKEFVTALKKMNTEAYKCTFKMGFHGRPSMRQLHLHIISDDFDSKCLKNPKHYNSFTTSYFIDADVFLAGVKADGFFPIDFEVYEDMVKQPMKCHRCGLLLGTNIFKAKKHFLHCTVTNAINNNSNY